ncbi:MAG TPA: ferrochelatase [Woeseiaceae bacterium]|nr:ferrochelatase [Woeseiaceae bacterium]
MPIFESAPAYEHGGTEALGVLVANLGTPDAPTPPAVRRYLAEFLADPRVVETPRWLWWPILHGFILRVRPARSAKNYAKIWTPEGSPLLRHSRAIAAALGARLDARLTGTVKVALGMSYGTPSLREALDELHAANARRILVLPLYPQYAGSTTGSVFDAVTALLAERRWVPELRFVNHYHDAPGYVDILAESIREYRAEYGSGQKLLFSFHGLPQQTLLDGDPYHCHCQKTARLVAEALGLTDAEWLVSFQSRVGRQEWLRPYTDETVKALGRDGLATVDVVCPGFAADCLETLEEIAMQNAAFFAAAGGHRLNYIPALNARDDHVAFLARLVEKHAAGWPETVTDRSTTGEAVDRDRSRRRALEMGAAR